MARVRAAFDPSGTLNPGKILPSQNGLHATSRQPGMQPLPAEGVWV